jgi:hypothetical protein
MLKDYIVYFTRSNGTKGHDTFTALTENGAKSDFRDCYRHDVYIIDNVIEK